MHSLYNVFIYIQEVLLGRTSLRLPRGQLEHIATREGTPSCECAEIYPATTAPCDAEHEPRCPFDIMQQGIFLIGNGLVISGTCLGSSTMRHMRHAIQ